MIMKGSFIDCFNSSCSDTDILHAEILGRHGIHICNWNNITVVECFSILFNSTVYLPHTHFLCISFSSENGIRAPRLLAPKQQCRPSICIGEIGNQVDTAHGHESHMCRQSMLKHNFNLDETELELHKARPRGQIREGADVRSCAAMIMNKGQMRISQSKGERKWCCCAK